MKKMMKTKKNDKKPTTNLKYFSKNEIKDPNNPFNFDVSTLGNVLVYPNDNKFKNKNRNNKNYFNHKDLILKKFYVSSTDKKGIGLHNPVHHIIYNDKLHIYEHEGVSFNFDYSKYSKTAYGMVIKMCSKEIQELAIQLNNHFYKKLTDLMREYLLLNHEYQYLKFKDQKNVFQIYEIIKEYKLKSKAKQEKRKKKKEKRKLKKIFLKKIIQDKEIEENKRKILMEEIDNRWIEFNKKYREYKDNPYLLKKRLKIYQKIHKDPWSYKYIFEKNDEKIIENFEKSKEKILIKPYIDNDVNFKELKIDKWFGF